MSKKNWQEIESAYRAGSLSNRQIAKKYGVSESAIRKKAAAEGWVRTEKPTAHRPVATILPPIREFRAIGEGRQTDPLKIGRDLALRLLDELDATTSHIGEIEDLIEDETHEDANTRRRTAMMRAVSLPARSMTLKTIAQALGALKDVEGEKGKKEQREDAAREAARGKFAPPAPPKLVVDNK